MTIRVRDLLNRKRYTKAKAEADRTDGVLCATLKRSGEPVYFVVSKDSPRSDIQRQAFEIREGRHMNNLEINLLAIAQGRADDDNS